MLFLITYRFRGVLVEKQDGFRVERLILVEATANIPIAVLSKGTNDIETAGNPSRDYGGKDRKEWKNAAELHCEGYSDGATSFLTANDIFGI
jgi:hypothetical protein